MERPSIELTNVWLDYPIYGAGGRSMKKQLLSLVSGGRMAQDSSVIRVQALKGINLRIEDGDRIGIIGGNGAGKTTLLRTLAGALRPARGRVRRIGVTSSLFDVYLGINSEANGWDNIMLRGLFLGMTPKEIRARMDEIVDFSGLTPEQLTRPVRTFSSGMSLRLAFSVSTCFAPDILLMDEWIWVSDANFMRKAQQRLNTMVDSARILVIATHSDPLIQELCNRAIYMREGEMISSGPVNDVLATYHAGLQ